MAREILLLTFSYIGCNLRERVLHNGKKGAKSTQRKGPPQASILCARLRNCFLR